ncbi:MAG: hypothetical protein GY854_06345 [Deltaproteobacteria bacterium]|nr:hypothetical protein [Deltaproteobacteria bacterium]
MSVRWFSASRLRIPPIAALLVAVALNPNALAQMTAQEFDALPTEDKRTVLVSALQKRDEAVRNVRATSVTRTYIVAFRDGVVGNPIEGRDLGRDECELRRDGGTYWANVKWIRPEDTKTPILQAKLSRDPEAGTTRSIARHGIASGAYGAISPREDKMLQSAEFLYWFDMTFDNEDRFPIKFMLNHKDAIVFDGLTEDGTQVKLSLVVKSPCGTKTYTRAMRVDPQKGFMPTWIHRRRERRAAPYLDATFSEFDLTVEELKEIDGVWFPVRFRTVGSCTPSVKKGEACVFETEASEIDLGSVKPADMEIVFPDDMKVHDLFTGKWTLAGAEIDPNAPTKPAEPIAPLEPIEVSTGQSRIVWLIGIVVACVGAILLVVSMRHRRSSPGV